MSVVNEKMLKAGSACYIENIMFKSSLDRNWGTEGYFNEHAQVGGLIDKNVFVSGVGAYLERMAWSSLDVFTIAPWLPDYGLSIWFLPLLQIARRR